MTDEVIPLEGVDFGPSKAAVFDRLLSESLKQAIVLEDRATLPQHSEYATGADLEAAYTGWFRDTYGFLLNAVTALQENVPRIAEAIASEVNDYLESGDAYPEWIWEWAAERGIDTEALRDEERARYATWLTLPPRPYQAATNTTDSEVSG